MGGELRVESTFGAGSTFWFELDAVPLPTAEPAVAPEQRVVSGYQGRRRTVLIVDDDVDSRSMLIQWLHPLGFGTLEADSGEAVLELLDRRPDLIIMDLVMPGVGGLQTIRSLRDRPGVNTLPIIATSASVSKEDAYKSRAAGADAFLAKPVDLMELQVLLGSLLSLEWHFAVADPASGAS
jgi:CheY-like chemotaxis protein